MVKAVLETADLDASVYLCETAPLDAPELPYHLYERTSPARHSWYEACVLPVEGENPAGGVRRGDRLMTQRKDAMKHYEELQTVAIPEDVPEPDLETGTIGTIATVYDGGRMLDVEVSGEDGATLGLVDLKVLEDGYPTLVAHKLLGKR